MSDLVTYWTTSLSAAQRAAWGVYATNTPVIDKLGNPMFLTGQNMFVRSNLGILKALGTLVEDAPTVYNLGSFTAPVIGATSAAGGTMSLAFTDTDEWANEDDAAMAVYVSRPQNASVNYFKGPYQYAQSILGDATTAPTSPASVTLPFAVAVDQRIFAKANVARADGRYSTAWRGTGLVTT